MASSSASTPKTNFVTNRKVNPKTPSQNRSDENLFVTPSKPRNNLVTPKRQVRPAIPQNTPECSGKILKTAMSLNTPERFNKSAKTAISHQNTPDCLNTAFRTVVSQGTPECFNKVIMETPNSAMKQRGSKEKVDEISNLTVAVRIRPMNSRELSCIGACDVVRVRNQDLIIRSNSTGNSGMSIDHVFQYDHIFWSCDESCPLYSSQEDVFLTLGKPLLNSAFRGYNACLLAYGQTGSGKTFSMMGRNNEEIVNIDCDIYAGLIPRFCRDLFQRISNLDSDATASVEVSYFEIYNEKIHDLLSEQGNSHKIPLKVREHPVWGPYVVDLSSHKVNNYKELRNWLILGNKNRSTAATSMNEKSSRSHSIFSIELFLTEGMQENDCSRRSKVSLVDLAGSERLSNSHNSEEKMKQGVYINKSLLTLGKVISSLADQKRNTFVPYRESVLTWLLKESLGGNSLTSMLATISPASTHLDETLATLRYACQARSIVNRARINENPHDRLIRELRLEVERLRALRKDYERNSLSCTSLSHMSDCSLNNTEELEELKRKLSNTESKLVKAEESWQQKFMETRNIQLQELAEAERLREELESKVRVMKRAEEAVKISPFRSNFLEELENVLGDNTAKSFHEDELKKDISEWCYQNNLETSTVDNQLIIKDSLNRKQATLSINQVNMEGYENISDFIRDLQWSEVKSTKKLSKNEVVATMNKIYATLSTLQPSDNEDNLSLLYAKVNKSLQSFETALINNLTKVSAQKTVTFDIKQETEDY